MSGETFGQMLRRFRERVPGYVKANRFGPERRCLSQNALARLAGITSGYVNRLEADTSLRADGVPYLPARAVVLSLAGVLKLDDAETDQFLFAAGLAPVNDYQTMYEDDHWRLRAEAAEAKLDIIRQAFDLQPDVLIVPRRRTG